MQIELVKIGKPYKVGNAMKQDLEYIRDGKNSKRVLVGYGKTKEVMQAINDLKEGDIAEVEMEKAEKDGQTFWNWVGIKKIEGPAASAAKKSEYKSTYETPEERAEKGVRITRMACLERAIEFHSNAPKTTLDSIFKTAEDMVAFVYETYTPAEVEKGMAKAKAAAIKGEDTVDDDLPF